MSQRELARAVGVSRTTIQNTEGCATTPSADIVARIAEATGWPINAFFTSKTEGIGRNVAAGFNAGVDKGLDSELLAAIASDSQFTSALAASARSESQILATIAAQYRASQFTMLDRLGLTTPTTTTNTTASTETVVNHNNIENNLSFTAPYADVRLLADEVVRRFGQLARQPS
jgi:transcriptional regulator with XRE-family HTH domain